MKRKMLFILISVFVFGAVCSTLLPQEYDSEEPSIQSALEESLVLPARAELESFVDGIMAVHMKDNHIAGATFSCVKDGEIFLAKGYGYADVKKRKPVDPNRTMFRPGSVSKLITWTAVMQLVEQGKIDLNADVNTYLEEFKIPETFPEPITMTHLLTHTPGFEEKATGVAARTAEDLMPLDKFLAKYMPARVRPPGVITSYSNYGTALAGYIVEVVSGFKFETYVKDNIFDPLGMTHSTFSQPLPADLAEHMSVGYKFKKGVFEADEFELIHGMTPAGSMSASGADMARFMIAHLQKGRFGENRIFSEDTANLMHSQLFAHDPHILGNAHGFWEMRYNNVYALEHGGDTLLFHSFLVLLLDHNMGFFVSYNSVGGGGSARTQLIEAILDRYYPMTVKADLEPPEDFKKQAKKFTGTYLMARTNCSTYEKIANLFMTYKVSTTKEGTLLIPAGGSRARQYVEIEPLVFQQINGQNRVVFREDNKGHITHLFIGHLPYFAAIKLPWYETPTVHLTILGAILLVFLSVLRWPFSALARRVCKTKVEATEAPRSARWVAGIMVTLFGIFLIGLLLVFKDPNEVMFGVPVGLKLLLGLPLLAGAMAVVVLFYTFWAWIKGYWTACARMHYTLVFFASVAFLWFLYYWNLLGFQY
ncbi:MAG: serine hydrolase domain-containing protein [Candidatus Aminicenantaceae bacterium]